MAEPILKWAGGKRQILSQIVSHFPPEEDIWGYHEPFFGGGAVFFRECHIHGKTVNDINTRLINFYEVVRDHPRELARELKQFKRPDADPNPDRRFDKTNRKGKEIKNYYYQVRELFNRRPNGEEFDEVEEAAQLLYLNRTCYNGLYRENLSGEFNVPSGNYSNPDWE
ncbi:DNA adenine methylase, partial [Halorubrum ezzemoulense]